MTETPTETAQPGIARPAPDLSSGADSDQDLAGARRSRRGRKLLGTLVVPVFLFVYMMIAMLIGSYFVNGLGIFVETVFYLIAGLGWVPPVVMMIRWMEVPRDDVG